MAPGEGIYATSYIARDGVALHSSCDPRSLKLDYFDASSPEGVKVTIKSTQGILVLTALRKGTVVEDPSAFRSTVSITGAFNSEAVEGSGAIELYLPEGTVDVGEELHDEL
ncbi:uncharacterized protein KD926_003150 [Aspergillus affinis]|uniref:uncharacterized protein n=1 Tax=Aspergillus affinis TaxID=1070780 RepID=UPI0022FEDA7F|nr:uncharacterized protein KD926_003150 [Aspergillus affinis]KAI9035672.1 hypothetical protein KD926_003150 [Aspergillus affinis]